MTDTASSGAEQSRAFDAAPMADWGIGYRHVPKRMVDILLVLLLAPVAIPLIGIMYTWARCDGGPGFFGHNRLGRGVVPFQCWKIRTMVPNATDKLTALLNADATARAEWERDRKLQNDPRVTGLGRTLRATSLDELPQLWNVLRGDMSLVGPRPVTADELEKYGTSQAAYLALRPGITGLWQVSGRNDVTYDTRVAFDVRYRDTACLRLDARILVQTVGVLWTRTGR